MVTGQTGLGNQATLTKIDKLRELNIGKVIPLPQLVVAGDQSSGKSSLLESLTGFSFPRGTGLCTRYVTQITCCRGPETSILVSIIPRPNADETLKAQLLQFQPCIKEMNNDDLAKIFEEANLAMGIRISKNDGDISRGAFSQDILKIEINGPKQDHLTVIDVPGIFRVATPGLTTESDIALVENMVKSYMNSPRTIILTVIPCNVDIATQEILKLANMADPSGVRTMGVLTKPDLATEKVTKDTIIDLVSENPSTLKLGYYIVKNRSADDNNISTVAEHLDAENAFFMAPPWLTVADRCGIAHLKERLRELLMNISKQETPKVRSEIEQHLFDCRQNLETMGPSRTDQSSQRLYLAKLASKFQDTTQAALNGYYTGDKIFKKDPNLKLITKIIKLNEDFSDVFWRHGHKQHFGDNRDDEGESFFGRDMGHVTFGIPLNQYHEIKDILTKDYCCPEPSKEPLLSHIEKVYESSRGPELGTFGGTILAIVFEEQTEKWEPLVLSHTSRAIEIVHEYIFQLIAKLCPKEQVRDQLWNALLVDKLRKAYRKAMNHARFLLDIERGGRPITFNHYFNTNLQKERSQHISDSFNAMKISSKGNQCAVNKDNRRQVCEDILDTLASYYKVSRKRFVDVICQQVVHHFLLEGSDSPLKVLGPELVMGLDPEQLEQIAGEDIESRQKRQGLEREIKSYEAALKVLRA
ncbi:interferon-induced GTP-binding protein Mx2 [Sclerotinia borealis F-4128]|uniref:Interferon-induced GTP-binding protein Mx2 n=1 Tax=Sclerotinia borealis (strain F-4128) TaxID=1432307 RepID=W9C978_SCLBF|nr:interferon-induced GTP-binding protein Mx2 [Sclerotinia borealis F-4128]